MSPPEDLAEILPRHQGVLERVRLRGILLGLNDEPALEAVAAQRLENRDQIEVAVAWDREDTGLDPVLERQVLLADPVGHILANVLEVDVRDPLPVRLDGRER